MNREKTLAKLEAVENSLRERGVSALSLFGSTEESNVDVLIEIAPGCSFSLVDLVSVKHFLEDTLESKVDVVIRDGLDPAIRDQVIREARTVF